MQCLEDISDHFHYWILLFDFILLYSFMITRLYTTIPFINYLNVIKFEINMFLMISRMLIHFFLELERHT